MTHRSPPNPSGRWSWRITLRSALHAPSRDRGTVLLMVVGVLALLAIIGVVYATLGRADRISSATRQRTQRSDDQMDSVVSYLAGVVGDAGLATYPEMTANADAPPGFTGDRFITRVRGYTYPDTDPYSHAYAYAYADAHTHREPDRQR